MTDRDHEAREQKENVHQLLDEDATMKRVDVINHITAFNHQPRPDDNFAAPTRILAPSLWMYLTLLGTGAALVTYAVDASVSALFLWRAEMNWGFWVFSAVALGLASEACVLLWPLSQGSGIPEMKSMLCGEVRSEYLGPYVLVGRVVGVVTALSAGLHVGKEGPFVHIASIIGHQLTRIPYFKALTQSPAMHKQLMAAAVAAGVTTTFGAPIGGTLFSIEVTSTYVTIASLWKTFFCAVMAMVSFEALHSIGVVELFDFTSFEVVGFSWELITFALLGVITGIASGLFVLLSARFMRMLNSTTSRISFLTQGGFRLVGISSLVTAIVSYWFVRRPDHEIINEMFNATDLSTLWKLPGSVLLFSLVKFVATAFSISLPLAAGVFTPVFCAGACLGRWYGDGLALISSSITPGAYAVAGATGLAAGVTRSIATAVIVFELTGQLHHLLPVLLVTLISFSVSSMLSPSIYDLILELKSLPYIPSLSAASYNKKAIDVMQRKLFFLTYSSTYSEALKILSDCTYRHIPLVNSVNDTVILGSVDKTDLMSIVANSMPGNAIPNSTTVEQTSRDSSVVESFEMSALEELSPNPHGAPMPEQDILNACIDFTELMDLIDEAPLQVTVMTPLPKLHFLFIMLGIDETFVTLDGKLQGIVTIKDLS